MGKTKNNINYKAKYIIALIAIILVLSCKNDNSNNKLLANQQDNGIQSTNSEIEAMRQAMLIFRNSLSSNLLNEASTTLSNERLLIWHNAPNSNNTRGGISYGDLTAIQLANFKNILQLFLSTDGYKKVDEITRLAEGFLSSSSTSWNPDFYAIDMFGNPETSGSWGFQLDGHHCAINFLVHGDKVSIVPAFLGGEPTVGTYKETTFDIFADERDMALKMYSDFSDIENKKAVSSGNQTLQVGPPSRSGSTDKFIGNYDYSVFKKGLIYTEMSPETKSNIILLMKEYVYNLTPTFADKWWNKVMENIDDTYFVWIDNVDKPSITTQFYYRIYNPYLWVEYDMENPFGRGVEDWNHVHTITRIPNNPTTEDGGDYMIFANTVNQNGPQTLFEHYAMANHHKMSEISFDYTLTFPNEHEH